MAGADEQTAERLYGQTGRLKVELDWLKKVGDQSAVVRQSWVVKDGVVPMSRQCQLASVCRATVYARLMPKGMRADDLEVSALIDQEYTRHPLYGSRKMVVFLRCTGKPGQRRSAAK